MHLLIKNKGLTFPIDLTIRPALIALQGSGNALTLL